MTRFLYNDPYALRNAMERLLAQPGAAIPAEDLAIPVDVYQDGTDVVIEAALPGVRLDDIELSCEEGLLTLRAQAQASSHDFAVQEIPRGRLARTLALPTECQLQAARATLVDGILRVIIPRARERAPHTIKVEVGKGSHDASRIVMEKQDATLDAVKGQDYEEIPPRPARRRSPGR